MQKEGFHPEGRVLDEPKLRGDTNSLYNKQKEMEDSP